MIQTFVGINAIRQHVEDPVRIHGIITHGGDAPNVIPGYTSGQFIVRADTMPQVDRVFEKVMGCIKGTALAPVARMSSRKMPHTRRRNPIAF